MEQDQRAVRAENRALQQLESDLARLRSELSDQLELLGDTVLLHDTALDRLNNDMADGGTTHCRGPNVPLTPFHGNRNEDFEQYIKQFELICTANNFAADKRAQILGSYLRDKAFFVYDSLPDATKTDYNLLKVALADRFQTADYRRFAHQKFQGRKQLASETVTDYACDLHRMGLAALASVGTDQRDALIREKFIAGLLPQLRELIIYSNPTTFNEALTLAERLEGLQSAKVDNPTRNVMLLENISDRLANLEVHTRENHISPCEDSVCVMENTNRRPRNGYTIQRKFNLGNYRQEFRPSGMVCYRCNRTGHIARNCPQLRNMNSVVCRLCNRMGHFARNCQRRGASLARRSTALGVAKPFGRDSMARTAGRINVENKTMATTTTPILDREKGSIPLPVEVVRWKPLIATMWSEKTGADESPRFVVKKHGTMSHLNKSESRGKDCADDACGYREPFAPCTANIGMQPGMLEQMEEISTVTGGNWRNGMVGRIANVVSKAIMTTRMNLVRFCCWCVLLSASISLAADTRGTYHYSEPMICQAFEGRALWKLPTTFNCPEGNHTISKTVQPIKFRLYKRNYIQYKSSAWKCVRLTETVETFTYFFGDENLKKQRKQVEAVSAEECTRMKNFKMCRNEPMIYQGGLYQTNRKMEWYYPGGGINCCHWKKFSVTNCFMYQSHVYKRHGSSEMQSTAGDVSNCKYKAGQCVLSDGSFMVWDVKNESFCDILPWKKLKGKMSGTSWLSDDSNLALTFTKEWRTVDCRGRPLLLSDQGIPAKPLKSSRKNRSRRRLSIKEIQNVRKMIGRGGIVSSAQLASSLQALELRREQNMQFAFSHALNNVCNFMRSVIELLKTQVLANPTMAIRALTNQSSIFAKSGGNVVEVFPCTQLNHFHYQFRPMNGTCSAQLPIKFHVNNKTEYGFLDPVTNIIHRFSVPTDCNLVRQVPVQLRDKVFIYHARNGEISPAHDIPEIKVLQWNIEPVFDMKATIFHEIVIYNWEELQTHISLNDIIGSLDRQREILQHMGITDEGTNPHEVAENAVAHIVNAGFFGFLKGLTADLFQVWTFLVCLYVTLCVLVVHCLPIRAMPVALNAGNAARKLKTLWTRWKIHRQSRNETLVRESQGATTVSEAEFGKLTTALLGRMNRQAAKAILPSDEMLEGLASAPLMEPGTYVQMRKLNQQNPQTPEANVQPFRVNIIYPVSETTIVVMVEGLAVECLLDTGSMHTIISSRAAKLLGLSIERTDDILASTTGHQLPVVGEVFIAAQIAKQRIRGRALVADGIPYEIIMGINFMKKLGDVRINFQTGTLEINGVTIEMKYSREGNNERAQPADDVSLGAGTSQPKPKQTMAKFQPKTYLIHPNPAESHDLQSDLAFVEEVRIDRNGEITRLPNPRETDTIPIKRHSDLTLPTKVGNKSSAPKRESLALVGASEITIDVFIEGMQANTLVDTGSTLTVVPLSVARLLRNPIKQREFQIVSMTGHHVSVVGEIDTIIRIGNYDITGTVVVAEQSPYDLIIGTDLLQRLDSVKINFKDRTIDLGAESIPMKLTARADRAIGVYLCQPARVAPKSLMLVMGMCFGLTPEELAEQTPCCFSPSTQLLTKYDVISQDAVVSPHEKLIPVTVMNYDRAPKFLPEKATLGKVEVLSAEEVCLLNAQKPEQKALIPTGNRRSKSELIMLNEEMVIATTLSDEEKRLLRSIVGKYEVLFAKSEYDLGSTKLVEHTIDTGDARPIAQKPYRTPHSLRPYLQKKIEEMLDHGIIQPSKSNWSSPVVLVKKKDSSDLRFCVDNRKLNDVTIKDNYPLKRIEDAFDMLHNARYFATLDLQSGYWQIPIQEADKCKTAFVTTEGLYEYSKMNFGLCNAPATFQRLMDQVLRGLDLKICMSYIDDIIVPAQNVAQLAQRLESIFERLLAAGLKLKLRKCRFGLEELNFLGFVVSKEGLKPDPAKIVKIANAKPPQNRDELRTFLGFTGWCKRFIEGYAKIAWPLTDLLQQSKAYNWNPAAQHAFANLKRLYALPPILAYPNLDSPFIICTDASNWAIGDVLCQLDDNGLERPISYDSRVLNSSERNYSTIEREMLAIFWAIIKKYRVYVYRNEFVVYTDHKPLLGVWKAPPDEGRLAKWCIRLQEYRPNMTLAYREGKSNVVADYLSRPVGEKPQLHQALLLETLTEKEDMREAQLKDNEFGRILHYLDTGELPPDRTEATLTEKWAPSYEVLEGILYKHSLKYDKLIVALPKSMRRDVLAACHDSLLGGHLGIRKTLSKIEKRYYWPKYYKDVVNWCRGCMACQSRKPPPIRMKAPLQPIMVNYINQRWGWDICGPLPLSQQGNRYILVCMEYFTKFPELSAIPDTKAERLAKIFIERIVLRYGCPEILLSDQGLNVHSDMIKHICKMLDISKLRTSAYHPQTDGLVERFNRTLHQMISMYVNAGHTDWCEFLPFLEFAYRSSVHETTKESPFFLMYGYDPVLPIDLSYMPSRAEYVTTDDDYKAYVLFALLQSRRLVANTLPLQQQQKSTYDRGASEPNFLEGDRILVYTPEGKKGRSKKFARNWVGPYRILKVSNNGVNLQVQAIGNRRSANTFWIHVNRAKRVNPEPGPWLVNTEILRPSDGEPQEVTNAGGTLAPSSGSPEHTQAEPSGMLNTSKAKAKSKAKCAICKKRGGDTQWLACDTCLRWFHFRCVGLDAVSEDEEWHCGNCVTAGPHSSTQLSRSGPSGSEDEADSDTTVDTVDD